MRTAFLKTLCEQMRLDPVLHVLSADTGFHVFDDFQIEFVGRYANMGIAEGATIGVAAGLALCGKRVLVYGIAPFVTLRCFEQVRNDLCGQRLPVTIVGVGGGLTYGPAGPSHHVIEDIAVMCALPNMTVICPGDPVEAALAVETALTLDGPCYLRLGKSGEPVVHTAAILGDGCKALRRGFRIRTGRGLAVIVTGNMLPAACAVCDRLAAAGWQPELISMPMVKPIGVELLVEAASRCGAFVTIEEHNVMGGLGSLVGAVIAAERLPVRLRAFGIPDACAREAGSQEFLRERHGLTADHIAREILEDAERLLQR